MTGSKVPRYLFLGSMLGVAVAVILFAMFYAQYRWLATGVITDSTADHLIFLQNRFAQQARDQTQSLADELAATFDASDVSSVDVLLARKLAGGENLAGVRFTSSEGLNLQKGELADGVDLADEDWQANLYITTTQVQSGGEVVGELTVAFNLDRLHAESANFALELQQSELERRRISYVWIGLGTLATLLVCALIVAVIVRDQTLRIRALKRQAEKLRDADFGEPLPVPRDDELGELAAVFNALQDELKTTTISRDYVDSVLSGMNDAIIITTSDGTIKRINKATTHLLGYKEQDLIGASIDFVVDSRKSGTLVNDSSAGLPRETFFESNSGESIPVSYTCSVLDSTDSISGDRIYAAQNTTERRRAEQRIRYLARIDALTKIPNRMQFQHLLQRGIARARRSDRSLGLIYIDIDQFKEINDTFGHLAGDTTLETVAERLSSVLPSRSVIGRLAGDEFAVIIDGARPDTAGLSDTDELAQDLLAKLANPFFVQGHEVFMTASMGIAFYPQDAPNVIDLIRNADAAMYHAKKSGGNIHTYYKPQMNEASVERLMTKSKLKRAFERDELLVHYQPKYNLATGEVYGAEALVRWELPERGLILPSDFIPIAEETNLIIEIGEWVLDKVCEDFRLWQRSVSSPGRVSVNLSLKQLKQRNFSQRISAIMRSYEVSPTSLELEITETTLMENPERTIKLLDQLYALGLHLAIDDFGTGYSSLSALQQFPISTLKIDQSFVRHCATNADDATLVGTIVQLGRNMHMDVVAEGVEETEQLAFLQSIDCTYAQGLLFGDPMSSDNYLELLLAQVEGTDTHRALFA
ncbi:MAG TPA: EAL domain-containing protein [Woeseiaceae bacterium]|nr:EAL domain-containing protein [Woeseiaceae bacterium]